VRNVWVSEGGVDGTEPVVYSIHDTIKRRNTIQQYVPVIASKHEYGKAKDQCHSNGHDNGSLRIVLVVKGLGGVDIQRNGTKVLIERQTIFASIRNVFHCRKVDRFLHVRVRRVVQIPFSQGMGISSSNGVGIFPATGVFQDGMNRALGMGQNIGEKVIPSQGRLHNGDGFSLRGKVVKDGKVNATNGITIIPSGNAGLGGNHQGEVSRGSKVRINGASRCLNELTERDGIGLKGNLCSVV